MILYGCRAVGMFALARWMTRKNLKILCYHGFEIVDESKFRPKLFMSAGVFEQRMAMLKRAGYHIVPLSDAVRNLYAGEALEDAVVITVDDGYDGFYNLALPILQKYHFVSTSYITTYYVEHEHPIFRLVVQYMFWKTSRPHVVLTFPGLDRMDVELTNSQRSVAAQWQIIHYGEKLASEADRVNVCQLLGEALGISYAEIVRSRMMQLMRPWQIQSLSAKGVSVQLHTHRHGFPDDNEAAARRELDENITMLNALDAGEKTHFCYPSGEWSPKHWKVLSEFAIESATTCASGLNTRDTPKYALSRILDSEDIHPIEFEAALCGFKDLVSPWVGRLLRRAA